MSASPTRRRGWSAAAWQWPSCVAGRHRWPCRCRGRWRTARWNTSTCRWPRRWLEGGSLTGKYLAATAEAGEEAAGAAPGRAPEAAPRRHDADGVSERVNRIAAEVVAVAAEIGRPPAQVAINWVRGHDHGCVVVPVIGARDASQLGVNLGCLEFELEAAQVERRRHLRPDP